MAATNSISILEITPRHLREPFMIYAHNVANQTLSTEPMATSMPFRRIRLAMEELLETSVSSTLPTQPIEGRMK